MNNMIHYSKISVNRRTKKALLKRNFKQYQQHYRNSWNRFVTLYNKIQRRLGICELFGIPRSVNPIVLDSHWCIGTIGKCVTIAIPVIKSFEDLR
jgi:hypothetical protein